MILILNKLESCAVLINTDFDIEHYYNKHKQIINKGSAHFSMPNEQCEHGDKFYNNNKQSTKQIDVH